MPVALGLVLQPSALPITRSGGIPYISPATGRMKSRSPAEAMYVTNPLASRYLSRSPIGAYPHAR